jgi:hypothetical protein
VTQDSIEKCGARRGCRLQRGLVAAAAAAWGCYSNALTRNWKIAALYISLSSSLRRKSQGLLVSGGEQGARHVDRQATRLELCIS